MLGPQWGGVATSGRVSEHGTVIFVMPHGCQEVSSLGPEYVKTVDG